APPRDIVSRTRRRAALILPVALQAKARIAGNSEDILPDCVWQSSPGAVSGSRPPASLLAVATPTRRQERQLSLSNSVDSAATEQHRMIATMPPIINMIVVVRAGGMARLAAGERADAVVPLAHVDNHAAAGNDLYRPGREVGRYFGLVNGVAVPAGREFQRSP